MNPLFKSKRVTQGREAPFSGTRSALILLGAKWSFVSRTAAFVLTVTSILVIGCSSSTSLVGTPNTSFIEDGVTPRHEIVETLGPPALKVDEQRAVAYKWERIHSTLSNTFLGRFPEPYDMATRYQVLVVQFDEQGKVVRHGLTQQSASEDFETIVKEWLSR